MREVELYYFFGCGTALCIAGLIALFVFPDLATLRLWLTLSAGLGASMALVSFSQIGFPKQERAVSEGAQ